VLNNAEKHVKDLESHIKKGEKLVEDKKDQMSCIEKKLNATN
jgi:hypothetical protein